MTGYKGGGGQYGTHDGGGGTSAGNVMGNRGDQYGTRDWIYGGIRDGVHGGASTGHITGVGLVWGRGADPELSSLSAECPL